MGPCHCGSGKKHKHCHLDADTARDRIERLQREIPPADPALMAEVMPILQAKLATEQETDRRLREEYGVHINYVHPVTWQGGKVWAIGSRVYPGRPTNETFHEFILHVLRGTLGEPGAPSKLRSLSSAGTSSCDASMNSRSSRGSSITNASNATALCPLSPTGG
jgi:hypothetical protein